MERAEATPEPGEGDAADDAGVEIEEAIYDIAVEMINRTRQPLDLNRLFKEAVQKLDIAPGQANTAIYNLLKKKLIVKGSLLTKEQILENEMRNKVYQHVKENPGTRVRDIRRALSIDHSVSHWHLAMLEKFGFIRKKRFGKYLAFYDATMTDKSLDELLCMLRVNTTYLVFFDVFSNPGTTRQEISNRLNIAPSTVGYHLEKLVSLQIVVESEEEKNAKRYTVDPGTWARVLEVAPSFAG